MALRIILPSPPANHESQPAPATSLGEVLERLGNEKVEFKNALRGIRASAMPGQHGECICVFPDGSLRGEQAQLSQTVYVNRAQLVSILGGRGVVLEDPTQGRADAATSTSNIMTKDQTPEGSDIRYFEVRVPRTMTAQTVAAILFGTDKKVAGAIAFNVFCNRVGDHMSALRFPYEMKGDRVSVKSKGIEQFAQLDTLSSVARQRGWTFDNQDASQMPLSDSL